MELNMNVTKRDGTREPLDMEKSNRVLMWACQGISGTSASDIAMIAMPRLYEGIPTTELHASYIQAAEELIFTDHHYAEVQSRLLLIDLLKRVYGDWDSIKPLSTVVQENVAAGLYYPGLYEAYSAEEWATIDGWIKHDRDYRFRGAGLKQFMDKYLVQDRATKTVYETPQVAYMLAAVAGFANFQGDRMFQVKRAYDQFSTHKINLPTPVMAGVRQRNRQYASCILIDVGDDLDSINDACSAANKYAAKRAGLGINVGRIRPKGAKIGNGEVVSTGLIPFLKMFESSIKSCSQGGIRDSSATVFLPIWHTEIMEVLMLKSVKTEEASAVRRLDYCPQWDSFLLRKGVMNQPITLFSPHEVPDLYAAFFGKDRSVFEALYEKYAADESLQFRTVIPGRVIYELFLVQAQETARYYKFDADHVNTHSPFLEPIYMSNLCVEVCLPTLPIFNRFSDIDYQKMTGTVTFEGLVQLCILGAINLGDLKIDDPSDMESRMETLVFFLNELMDNMDFTVPQSARATQEYRPLGIGVINYAYLMAKRGLRYGEPAALDLTHVLAEQMYYFALKASNAYAKLKGKKLPAWDRLIYSQGRTLRDTYCRRVDELTQQKELCDWPTLQASIAEHGLYNSTLIAYMPTESSSSTSNATSGTDKIRALVTVKGNKKRRFVQVAPEPVKLKNAYDMLWDMDAEGMNGVIKTAAVFQKWTCQSGSTNFSYNPEHYPGNRVPMVALMNHTQLAARYGVKTRYYINTKGEEDAPEDIDSHSLPASNGLSTEVDAGGDGCESGACKL